MEYAEVQCIYHLLETAKVGLHLVDMETSEEIASLSIPTGYAGDRACIALRGLSLLHGHIT